MDDKSFSIDNMIVSRIKNIRSRYGMFKKMDALPIFSSGIDSDGDPFVVLNDGTRFFGSRVSRKRDKILYNLLSKRTRSVLIPECTQVALDIMIRYYEGGLKYGGPKKQSRYEVKVGDRVAEMGAYQGFCSVKLAQQVGKDGHVVAIEPMPDNYRLLEKNMKANRFTQAITVNKGVWDESKILVFNRVKGDNQSSSIEMTYSGGDKFEVPADTLDSIFGEIGINPSDFMIIQLNGAEINGLRGLLSFRPKNLTIAARYDTEGEDAALVIKDELLKRGYEVEIDQEDFLFAKLK